MATGYATPSDLQKLALGSSFLQTVPVAEQTGALETASDVVDSYLRTQFTLPLKNWSQDIVRCVCIIATYDLAVKRGYNPSAAADVNIRQRYEDCMDHLKMIAEGTIIPGVVDSGAGVSAGSYVITSSQRGWSSRGTSVKPGPFEGD